MTHLANDVSIVICGEAGQGVDTIAEVLTAVLKKAHYNIFVTKEFMSRIRGGTNSCTIRVSSEKVKANINRIDFLIPLSKEAMKHVDKRITSDTIVFSDERYVDESYRNKCKINELSFNTIAKEVGGAIYSNTVASGLMLGLFNIDEAIVKEYIEKVFSHKGKDIVKANNNAIAKGYELAQGIIAKEKIEIKLHQDKTVEDDIIVTGAEAVGMGAIAGGCNFISAYPMSPATGVLVFLAQNKEDFGIIVEQVEDEIASINMALGAWYAGARAITTTSGGGFALMGEGISLAGMIESPMVVHVAQRPGPATGLPTRTEQGDFNLILYSGHGDFPRAIYTPGDLQEAFYLTSLAFGVADSYQLPAFVLTDQYLMDSFYNTEAFDLEDTEIVRTIIETTEDYKRYELNDTGISPRGIPGHGTGLVQVDSDEHDETGHITESMDVRSQMVEKRLNKLEKLKEATIPPVLYGPEDYKTLIIGWGTTKNMILEAMKKINNPDLAYIHYSQVYPLHEFTVDYLTQAVTKIVVESNVTAQFAQFIRQETGIEVDTKILKHDGLAFSVEELVENIQKVI